MFPDALIVAIVLLGVIILFIGDWWRAEAVALVALLVLAATGVLSPQQVLNGFASPAVITIAALLVLGAALVRTGAVKWLAKRIGRLAGGGRARLTVVTVAAAGLLSGFINIIAAVSVLLPAAVRLGMSYRLARKRLLMPVAFGGMVGANLTLIGASHNLVVDDLLRGAGFAGFAFFEFAPIGLVLLGLLIIYTFLTDRLLLPGWDTDIDKDGSGSGVDLVDVYQLWDRVWEVWVNEDSSLVDEPVSELKSGKHYGVNVLSVIRDEERLDIEKGDLKLKAGDVLLLEGKHDRVKALCEDRENLTLIGEPRHHPGFTASATELVEVTVTPRSGLLGKTLRDAEYRGEKGLTAIGLWRDDQPMRTDVRDTPLEAGDGVLFFGARSQVRAFSPEPDFVWVHPPPQREAPPEARKYRAITALIFAVMILSVAVLSIPVALAALSGAVLVTAIGALPARQVYSEIDWNSIVLIAALLPLGTALAHSGAAGLIADALVALFAGYGELAVLVALAVTAMILTQPLHNAAVAVTLTPVALDMAQTLGANPRAFAVTVLVAASANFLLPVGHPAPLLAREPANYRVVDYLRFGLGMNLLTLLVIALMVPWLFPL